jgi:F420-0:gamma-glutamyl ligase
VTGDGPSPAGSGSTEAITRRCRATLYPALCVSEIAALPGAAAARDADLVPLSLDATRRRMADALADATELARGLADAAEHCSWLHQRLP